jgi:hypothetical protein
MELIHPKVISIKGHPTLDEFWVQRIIAEDPSILNLGDLILKDKERMQPRAGRLDLLLQDPETLRRYEVEVQLGSTDESHIIRTLEYWDIERKRYPQYDHCAVIVAEEVTSRFLNVIGLFNGSVPLIAIQMKALQFDESKVALVFTTVLDELSLGLEDDDEKPEPTDRSYWIGQSSEETILLVDQMLQLIKGFAPEYELKYNKYYIGLAKNKRANNFVGFVAKRKHLIVSLKIKYSDDVQKMLDDASLEVLAYDKQWNQFRFRLTKADFEASKNSLVELMKVAFDKTE